VVISGWKCEESAEKRKVREIGQVFVVATPALCPSIVLSGWPTAMSRFSLSMPAITEAQMQQAQRLSLTSHRGRDLMSAYAASKALDPKPAPAPPASLPPLGDTLRSEPTQPPSSSTTTASDAANADVAVLVAEGAHCIAGNGIIIVDQDKMRTSSNLIMNF
jgi:hypothetical protein